MFIERTYPFRGIIICASKPFGERNDSNHSLSNNLPFLRINRSQYHAWPCLYCRFLCCCTRCNQSVKRCHVRRLWRSKVDHWNLVNLLLFCVNKTKYDFIWLRYSWSGRKALLKNPYPPDLAGTVFLCRIMFKKPQFWKSLVMISMVMITGQFVKREKWWTLISLKMILRF